MFCIAILISLILACITSVCLIRVRRLKRNIRSLKAEVSRNDLTEFKAGWDACHTYISEQKELQKLRDKL